MTNAEHGPHDALKCPRCGRTYSEPGVVICPSCNVGLVRVAERPQMPAATTLKVRVAPVLGEALASVKPGEDIDEALLRALKARYPDEAANLLPALTRIIDMEAQRANEDRQQAVRRLAQSDPGPEIVLRISPGEPTRITAESRVIRINGKEYHSLEEVPPHLRGAIERAMSGKRTVRRAGCAWAILAGWLLALLRGGGR
jgi:hypothetical protein